MLALHGGTPIREKPWPKYPIIGDAEKQAVKEVLDGGLLQGFTGAYGPGFLGGPRVKAFEKMVADYHDIEFAVSFTSATAALHGAVVAVGVQPGEEVIVSPYSFSTSASCALMHNAIPVFVDIAVDNFCISPEAIERAITPRTRAIIPVHIFGGPADMGPIMEIANKHDLRVIEDAAQAPGACYKGHQVGTMGDCGVFSFVGEKHASCGEGGMLITNDPETARTAQLVRNHGECLYEPILGYNYRMTEVQAAIGAVQWAKLDDGNQARRLLALYLSGRLKSIKGLTAPYVRHGDKHSYYVYAVKYDEKEIGISRGWFVEALQAEGIPFWAGYNKPLYLLPLYQQRAHYAYRHYKGDVSYRKGLCPVVEYMWERGVIATIAIRPPATLEDMDDIVMAFEKVLEHAYKNWGKRGY